MIAPPSSLNQCSPLTCAGSFSSFWLPNTLLVFPQDELMPELPKAVKVQISFLRESVIKAPDAETERVQMDGSFHFHKKKLSKNSFVTHGCRKNFENRKTVNPLKSEVKMKTMEKVKLKPMQCS